MSDKNKTMTSPKVDFLEGMDANKFPEIAASLPDYIPADIVKNFYKTLKTVIRPGTYLSGDAGEYPLGLQLLRDVNKHRIGDIRTHLLYPETSSTSINRSGLSPDSYSSIIRQGLRPGNSLRYGEPFIKWNNSAVKNKHIYDAYTNFNNGSLPIKDYLNVVNKWIDEIGGTQKAVIKNGQVLIPHPFVFYNKQGGILKQIK